MPPKKDEVDGISVAETSDVCNIFVGKLNGKRLFRDCGIVGELCE
jgi:hypothetical protein